MLSTVRTLPCFFDGGRAMKTFDMFWNSIICIYIYIYTELALARLESYNKLAPQWIGSAFGSGILGTNSVQLPDVVNH